MRVLIVNPQPDCAGVGYGFARAGRLAGYEVHSVANGRNYLDYPQDWIWSENQDEIRAFKPDLYMLSNGAQACVELLGFKPERAIVFYHGSDIRVGNKPTFRRQSHEWALERGWATYASTLDLEWLSGAVWLPPPIFGVPPARPADVFTVSHSPTNRRLKGTRVLLDAVRCVRERGYRIELDLIEGVSNAEALRRKAQSHVHFDQLYYCLAFNSVEAMAMGIPVITGAVNPGAAAYYREKLTPLPYLDAHPDRKDAISHVRDLLVTLIEDESLRDLYSKRGRKYVSRYHSPESVAARLDEVWSKAC